MSYQGEEDVCDGVHQGGILVNPAFFPGTLLAGGVSFAAHNPFLLQSPVQLLPVADYYPELEVPGQYQLPIVLHQPEINEIDQFLDTVLVERPKNQHSSIVPTPVKLSRPLSPLLVSVPKVPKAMLTRSSQTPTKASTKSEIVKSPPAPVSAPRQSVAPALLSPVPTRPKLAFPFDPLQFEDSCYSCLSQDHTFLECKVKCPHCGKDGHKPVNCTYRTMADGTVNLDGHDTSIGGSKGEAIAKDDRPANVKIEAGMESKEGVRGATSIIRPAASNHRVQPPPERKIRPVKKSHNLKNDAASQPPQALRTKKKSYNLRDSMSDVDTEPLGIKRERRSSSPVSEGARLAGRTMGMAGHGRSGARRYMSYGDHGRARYEARGEREDLSGLRSRGGDRYVPSMNSERNGRRGF